MNFCLVDDGGLRLLGVPCAVLAAFGVSKDFFLFFRSVGGTGRNLLFCACLNEASGARAAGFIGALCMGCRVKGIGALNGPTGEKFDIGVDTLVFCLRIQPCGHGAGVRKGTRSVHANTHALALATSRYVRNHAQT